tara:strand:- start:3117 stop:3569 length:453 start_codon:yes stop_codon:yes gene_type:complete
MSKEFKVLQDCYYGEPGEKAVFYKADSIYVSATLTEEKAPKFLKLAKVKVAAPVAPVKDAIIFPKNAEGKDMTYNEMKKFVAENDIDTVDLKGATLAPAIIAFVEEKATIDAEQAQVEQDGQEIAADLGNTPAAPLTDENAPESPIVNAE